MCDNIDNGICGGISSAGTVPDGSVGTGYPLRVELLPNGDLTLTWDFSCAAGDTDYGVYEGTLGNFTSHTKLDCNTGGTTSTFMPAAGDTYYIVVPSNGSREGSYGTDSTNTERPQGVVVCLDQLIGCS